MGRVLFIILAVFLLLGAFTTPILEGIEAWRTEDTTESFAVTTAAAQTTANVTLANDLFQNDVAEVITITSNITGEAPIATSYTSATKVLLLSALNASATHTIIINYLAETDSTVIRSVGAFLGVIIIGALIIGIFQGSKGRR